MLLVWLEELTESADETLAPLVEAVDSELDPPALEEPAALVVKINCLGVVHSHFTPLPSTIATRQL